MNIVLFALKIVKVSFCNGLPSTLGFITTMHSVTKTEGENLHVFPATTTVTGQVARKSSRPKPELRHFARILPGEVHLIFSRVSHSRVIPTI